MAVEEPGAVLSGGRKGMTRAMKKSKVGCIRKAAVFGALCMTAAMLLAAGKSTVSYGAESSVIESVNITFKASFGEAEEVPEPEITVSGNGCSFGGVEYHTDHDKWKPGSKVRITVTVEAAQGKIFPASLKKEQCKVRGAEFVSAKASGDGRLQVKVEYKPISVLGNTSRAGWSATVKNRAVWNAVDYAPGYTVVLYGDNKVVKKLTVETTYADLDSFIKDDGRLYYYEVQAVPITSEDKKCFKAGILVTSSENEFLQEDTSSGASSGNGAFGGWKKESDQWYYYDSKGNPMKGWQYIEGAWYYMNQYGQMHTGWLKPSGNTWFYLGENGVMQTGWIQPTPGAWYYMDGSGYMQRGWIQSGGKWYYLAQDGRMQTGWVQAGGAWYYLYEDGSMAANTVIEGRTLGSDGAAR